MFRPPTPEPVTIPGPSGTLEGIYEQPDAGGMDACAVILHPHPLAGGTMTNKVVHSVARALQEFGLPTLRFNFRGVGASCGVFDNGRGETDDSCAAVSWLRQRCGLQALWLAGFSFGSMVALQAAPRCQAQRLISVAPPVGRWDFSAIPTPGCPWLIVQGDQDELVDALAVRHWAQALNPPPQMVMVPGAGHFFHGRLHDLKSAVLDFAHKKSPKH